MPLVEYFDDFIKRRPENKNGYIRLSKENFRNMTKIANTKEELEHLIYIYANYIGHRNFMPQKYIETMIYRAAKIGHPEVMFKVFGMHSELLWHPSPAVIDHYFNAAKDLDYEVAKEFYSEVKGEKLLNLEPQHWK